MSRQTRQQINNIYEHTFMTDQQFLCLLEQATDTEERLKRIEQKIHMLGQMINRLEKKTEHTQ